MKPLTELQVIQLNEEIENIRKIANRIPPFGFYDFNTVSSPGDFLHYVAEYRGQLAVLDKCVFNLFALVNKFSNQNFYTAVKHNPGPAPHRFAAPQPPQPTLDDI